MNARRTLRLISLIMLIVAVVYIFCALPNSTLGTEQPHTLLKIEINVWRVIVYAVIMVSLFVASFFVKGKK